MEPRFERTLHWLDPTNQDDRIIASVLELQRAVPSATVILVTGDINLQNKSEAANLPYADPPPESGGVETLQAQTEGRPMPEPTPEEIRRYLQERIRHHTLPGPWGAGVEHIGGMPPAGHVLCAGCNQRIDGPPAHGLRWGAGAESWLHERCREIWNSLTR
jgi:hypothetical protein